MNLKINTDAIHQESNELISSERNANQPSKQLTPHSQGMYQSHTSYDSPQASDTTGHMTASKTASTKPMSDSKHGNGKLVLSFKKTHSNFSQTMSQEMQDPCPSSAAQNYHEFATHVSKLVLPHQREHEDKEESGLNTRRSLTDRKPEEEGGPKIETKNYFPSFSNITENFDLRDDVMLQLRPLKSRDDDDADIFGDIRSAYRSRRATSRGRSGGDGQQYNLAENKIINEEERGTSSNHQINEEKTDISGQDISDIQKYKHNENDHIQNQEDELSYGQFSSYSL